MSFQCLDLNIRTLLVPLPKALYTSGPVLQREGSAFERALAAKEAADGALMEGKLERWDGAQREDLKER